MQDGLHQLIVALAVSRHFEDAAAAALRALLTLSHEALTASPYAGSGRLLRGMVHLRPGDGYLRLAVLEADATALITEGEGRPVAPHLVASATAWRAILRHRCALSIDVHRAVIQPHRRPIVPPEREAMRDAFQEPLANPESRERFLGRGASHVCALPLRVPGGGIEGMITLEASCLPALGREFIWRAIDEGLQLLVDAAALHLTSLPGRPQLTGAEDELLPVAGAAVTALLPVLRIFTQQDETLLVSGPTGAGKSRLARWCHAQSPRHQGPFEALDLSTVPRDLQVAELFGWRKGAFTGAFKDTLGAVGRAEGGTLFIDEVDKLSLETQAGLLHLLETRSYRVLGEGAGERRANLRFIVGTNADLREAVRQGRFREDLYYRINVLPIRLPPLEERRDEIPQWAQYMAARRHRERSPGGEARLTPGAERLLAAAPWPGNLRQLDNIIRRAYALALAEVDGAAPSVLLEERHIAQALGYEGSPRSQPALMDALNAAAERFVDEVERRASPLNLDYTEVFRGFVLGVATRRWGREQAFRRLGREKLVMTRNHHRTLKRELERVEALFRELGDAPQSVPFAELLEQPDPET